MGSVLPSIEQQEFFDRLQRCSPVSLDKSQLQGLYVHFSELRKWNPRLSLVGPGSREELVERHYGESLAALPLVGGGPHVLVDVGSGGGFPGLVMALARRDLETTLIEARQRKWSFLMSVCRKASLSCTCLNARVGSTPVRDLPAEIDLITSRAVGRAEMGLDVLLPRLKEGGKVLLWVGTARFEAPARMTLSKEIPLSGSHGRRILVLIPNAGA
jgi:16S rRNA (guanine527-N7)-methyltransferase